MRKDFAEGSYTNCPFSRLTKSIFKLCTNIQFSHIPRPATSACTSLIAEATEIVAFVIAYVLKARDINTVRTTTIVVAIVETFHTATSSKPEMMIHYVVTEFAAAAAQS